MDTLIKNETLIWTVATIAGAGLLGMGFWVGIGGSGLFMVLGILSILLLGARDLLTQKARDQKESIQLSENALGLESEYTESDSFNVLGWPDCFELTKKATAQMLAVETNLNPDSMLGKFASLAMPKARNVIMRSSESHILALFNFENTENDVTYRQAVVAIKSSQLDFDYFRIVPANLWSYIADKFQERDSISNQHHLVCDERSRLYALSEIAKKLGSRMCLEVGEGFMLLYRKDRKPIQSYDISQLMDEAERILEVVVTNLSSSPSSDQPIQISR